MVGHKCEVIPQQLEVIMGKVRELGYSYIWSNIESVLFYYKYYWTHMLNLINDLTSYNAFPKGKAPIIGKILRRF